MFGIWSKQIMEPGKFQARGLSRFFRSFVSPRQQILKKLNLISFFLKALLMASIKIEESPVTKKAFPAFSMPVQKKKKEKILHDNLSPIKYSAPLWIFL